MKTHCQQLGRLPAMEKLLSTGSTGRAWAAAGLVQIPGSSDQKGHPDAGSVSIPAPSESQISCSRPRAGVKPELCLQEGHKLAGTQHPWELPGFRRLPKAERGPAVASGTQSSPFPPARKNNQDVPVFPPILQLESPLEEEIPLLTPKAHLGVQGGVWAPADLWGRGNAPILSGKSPQSTPIKSNMLNYSHSWPCIFPLSALWVLFSSCQIIKHKG